MLSSRRAAYFGLWATTIVLVLSLTALVARTLDLSSSALRVGRLAPTFALPDLAGQSVALQDLRGQAVVLCFSAARCPASNRYLPRVQALAQQYADDNRVRFLAVNTGPADDLALTELRVQAKVAGLPYPTLIDADKSVANHYAVAATPTFCLIDAHGVLRYAGPFDDNPDAPLVTRHYLPDALTALLKPNAPTN